MVETSAKVEARILEESEARCQALTQRICRLNVHYGFSVKNVKMQVLFKRYANANTTNNLIKKEIVSKLPQLKDNKKSQEQKLLIYAEGQNIYCKRWW